ncbi:TRAP transporter small permease [Bacillus sp. AK128]
MNSIKKLLDKVLGTVSIFLFGFLVLLVTWQVITRFVFNDPSVISEELAKYCFVWLVLFGAAYVFGERGHMAIEFIKDRFPLKLKVAVEVFIELVVIFFAALVLVKGGYSATTLAWTQVSASLGVPVGYLYSAIPVSGLFIIFYSVYNICESINKREQQPIEPIDSN